MNHLTDSLLNEYLDNALEASQRREVEAHLEQCAACRAEVDALRGVFHALGSLPERSLERDLAPAVLARLAKRTSSLAWKLALAVQAGFSIGLLVIFSPFLADRLSASIAGLARQATTYLVTLPGLVKITPLLPAVKLPQLTAVHLPIFFTRSRTDLWLVLGITAALLFIVGNVSLLFHQEPKDRQ